MKRKALKTKAADTEFPVFTRLSTEGDYRALQLVEDLSTGRNKINIARSKRLLFVDDEPSVRETLSIILRRYGFSTTVASTISEAIEEIKRQEFDLLLCDLNIHREGDGYEVIRAMREANPRCVTMVLTGYPGVESAV